MPYWYLRRSQCLQLVLLHSQLFLTFSVPEPDFPVTTVPSLFAPKLANMVELVSAPKLANAQPDGSETNVRHVSTLFPPKSNCQPNAMNLSDVGLVLVLPLNSATALQAGQANTVPYLTAILHAQTTEPATVPTPVTAPKSTTLETYAPFPRVLPLAEMEVNAFPQI
jgi:hypothetical protein